jgi:hypothetical protein
MKQNVSLEDMQKLTINQLNKIIKEIHIPKYYIQAVQGTLIYEEHVLVDLSKYLTVGKLIEILSGQCSCIDCVKRMMKDISFCGVDFCDALWEVLKSKIL